MKALHGLLIGLLLATSAAAFSADKEFNTVELQHRADMAKGADCAHLSMQAARQTMEDANRYFETGDLKAAHTAIDVSVHYARRSVDCSLQSRKAEKAVEIDIRKLIRRVQDVQKTLDTEDRPHLTQSLAELEEQRDRLLRGIFGAAVGSTPEKKP
jgi:hypothetical protein